MTDKTQELQDKISTMKEYAITAIMLLGFDRPPILLKDNKIFSAEEWHIAQKKDVLELLQEIKEIAGVTND
jgi:hypothetical protein